MEIRQTATVEVQVNGEAAKRNMQDLENYAVSLKGKLADAHKVGDTKKIKQLEKELRQTNAELKVMRTNAKNIDVAMNNIGVATPKELRNLIKDINSKLNSGHVKRGSAEWKKYQEQLKQVNAELRKVNAESKETEGWLTRFNNGFTRWGALAASGIAAITGVSLALSRLRKNRDDKEASSANLKALTGLNDSSIQWLTRQADILSTTMEKSGLRITQSSKEILEAYMLVGSAKPDLLDNKEALNAVTIEAMRLASAAKMDLKEAVDAVTLSMNQYGAASNEAAKYTNVMAAGSKFGSAAVQSITAAVTKAGVSASGAHVPIEELVGSIETLAEKGIKDEVAGTGLKMFFLRLQTGAKDTNPAVVGLQTALKNLQKLSTQGIVDRFGAETYTVAKTMIDCADKVDYYTKAVTGTSVAMEQAAINSDTNEAKMAQYKNQITEAGNVLMEKLNPSLTMLTGWTTKFIKAAPALIDFTKEYGAMIAWCSAVILVYMTRLKIIATYHAVVNTITKAATIISGAYRLASIALNDALAGDCRVMARFGAQMAKTNVATKLIAASTMLYRAGLELLTFRFKGAATAMKGFWTVMKGGPIGVVIAGFLAIAGAIFLYNRRLNETEKAQKAANEITLEANKSISEEKNRLDALKKVLFDSKKSYGERKWALGEIQKIVPEYHASLTKEGELINNNTDALDGYIEKLLITAKQQAANTKLQEALNTRSEWFSGQDKSKAIKLKNIEWDISDPQNSGKSVEEIAALNGVSPTAYRAWAAKKAQLDKDVKLYESMMAGYTEELAKVNEKYLTKNSIEEKKCSKCGNYPCTCPKDDLSDKEKQKKIKEALKKVEAAAAKEEALIKAKYAKGDMAYRNYCKAINENEIKELDNKMALYDKESNEYNQLLAKKQDLLKKGLDEETKFTVEELDARAKEEEIALVSSYYDRKIKKYALEEGLFQVEIETLQKKQALYAKDSKEWHDYEKQITDRENNEKLRKQEEYQKLLSSIREEYSKKDIKELESEELNGLEIVHQAGLIQEEEYQQLLQAIKRKYAEQEDAETQTVFDKKAEYYNQLAEEVNRYYSQINGVMSSYSQYAQACSDLEIAKIERRYDVEIEAAGDNKKKVAKLEKEKDQAINKEKKKANKKATSIQIAQALAETAMAALRAYAAGWEAGFPAGPILAPLFAGMAVASGMIQVATIRKQAQAQEEGYYKGGFSGPGDYTKEAGPVHYGEFIANHHAVNNPELDPVFQLINTAQKNNTVGLLTAEDVSMALGKGKAYTVSSTGFSSTATDDKMELMLGLISNSMGRTSEVIEGLAAVLDEGIESYVTIDGERGFEKQYSHYKKLKANKSR